MLSFIIGLLFLAWFSYVDIKYQEIENGPILAMLIVGVTLSVFSGQIIATSLLIAFTYGSSYLLWYKKTIGGADAKILPSITPFFSFVGIREAFNYLFIFLIIFMIIGILYSWSYYKLTKRKKAPFVPAITISYILLYLVT